MKNVTVRLEESTVQRLDRVAETHGDSRSEYVRNLIVTDLDGDATTDDSQEERKRLRETINDLRDERDKLREDLTEKRVEAARLDAENERLQSDLERVRDERDSAQARYQEAHTKVKLHNSQKNGVLARLSGIFSRE